MKPRPTLKDVLRTSEVESFIREGKLPLSPKRRIPIPSRSRSPFPGNSTTLFWSSWNRAP